MSRQEGGWCVHRRVFLQGADALTMAQDWDLPSHGAVDLLRQASRRCAGGMNRSSGKLQAELMAVQAAPIVCFEERTPAFIGSQRFCRKNFTAEPMGMTHRLRRGSTGAALWGCCFAWVGVQVVSGKHLPVSGVRQLCRKGTHSGGLTRRLRRERWGCRPERGSTFFRCERKYQRKPAARRLREKGFYCPF